MAVRGEGREDITCPSLIQYIFVYIRYYYKHDSNKCVTLLLLCCLLTVGRLEITSGSTLNAIVEVEDGVKVWHLVGCYSSVSWVALSLKSSDFVIMDSY